jgi:hypothetical protein
MGWSIEAPQPRKFIALAGLAFGVTLVGQILSSRTLATQPYVSEPLLVGATPIEEEMFEEALDDYEDAGLVLPHPMEVEFTDRAESCAGHPALYIYSAHDVAFCRPAVGEWMALRRLILHELGHAWDDLWMTDEKRVSYMCSLDIDPSIHWLEPGLAHEQRPGEIFANTVGALVRGIISQDRFRQMIGDPGSTLPANDPGGPASCQGTPLSLADVAWSALP